MALNDVIINKIRKGLNRPAPVEDSIFGLVAGGIETVDVNANPLLEYNTPVLLYGIEDAEALGVTAFYDTDNKVLLHYHINQHFKFAPGQPLWLYIVTQSTPQTDMWDQTSVNGVADLIAQCASKAQGAIKVVSTVLNPLTGYNPTITDNIDEDVLTAVAKAQQLANTLFAAHRPIDCVIEGRNFGTSAANAHDLRLFDSENVGVVILQDLDICALDALHQGYADVSSYTGLAASKYYSTSQPGVSIGNNPAEVGLASQGNIQDAANNSFLRFGMANQPLSDLDSTPGAWGPTAQGVLYTKHYVTCRTFANVAGVYIAQAFTCAADTSDMIQLQMSRVYNKAARGIYGAYVPYINGKVQLTANSTLPGEVCKALEDVGNQVFVTMVAQGDISAGKAYIDPTQNITLNRKLTVKWKIVMDGYLEAIEGELSYTVTL